MTIDRRHDDEVDEASGGLQLRVDRQARLLTEQRLLLDSLPAMIWFKDGANRILRCNRAAAAAEGRTVAELEGHATEEFYPDEAAKYLADDLEVMRTGRAKVSIVEPLKIESGEKRWVKTDKVPYRDETGRIAGVVVFAVDITDLKRTEDALRVSEERYRLIFEHASDGIFVCAPNGAFLDVNARLCEMLGYTPGELMVLSTTDVLAPRADGEDVGASSSGAVSGTHRLVRRDGAIIFGEITTTRLFDGRLQGIVRDVTERARFHAQRLSAERMLSVGTLAASVAHEINNPLAYVTLNLEQVRRRLASDGSAARDQTALDRLVAETQEGVERVRLIVQDLKTFSRANEEVRGPVDLCSSLDSVVRMAESEVRSRARIVKSYGVVPAVMGNEARLGQVLLNLVLNAAQAIPEGNLDAHEIRLTTRTDGAGRAVVEVSDTGCGVPPSVLGRIFDPFFTTKPFGEGTGLGLTVCQNIVRALGGEIEVESSTGAGATFRVVLPACESFVRATAASPPAPKAARRARVLVVDDEERFAKSLAELLSDHDVVVVHTGTEAVTLCTLADFDCILCDVTMPDITGMDVYDRLAVARPGYESRIVFMTGGTFTSRAVELRSKVSNTFLEKPFDVAVIERLLAALA